MIYLKMKDGKVYLFNNYELIKLERENTIVDGELNFLTFYTSQNEEWFKFIVKEIDRIHCSEEVEESLIVDIREILEENKS